MFKNLQQKWGVGVGRLVLIIATFAMGGSLCGYAGRQLLKLFNVEGDFLRIVLYIVLITVLWPLAVIFVSIPMGQFLFFKNYLKRVYNRIRGIRPSGAVAGFSPLRIAIFASGTGSNAEKIIQTLPGFFKPGNPLHGTIAVIVTDNPKAGVINIAAKYNVPAEIINLKNKTEDELAESYFSLLKKYNIDFIVLAGYLKKIPGEVIKAYPKMIVNIHPALLPAYGGAGMYGKRVHEAVINAGEKQSGITIHYVDEVYDNGEIVFQAACDAEEKETPETLAKKILLLEHRHYPKVIADILQSQNPR